MEKIKMNAKVAMIIFLGYMNLFLGCNLYEKNERVLESFKLKDATIVTISYVDMGATTKEVIQIKIKRTSGNDSVIRNFEKDYLKSAKLIGDSLLYLELTDTGSKIIDTATVILKHY